MLRQNSSLRFHDTYEQPLHRITLSTSFISFSAFLRAAAARPLFSMIKSLVMAFAQLHIKEKDWALRVFGTFELLELVLTYVPPVDLIQLRRVASKWNATIGSSTILQRRLFLKPNGRLPIICVPPSWLDRWAPNGWRMELRKTSALNVHLNPFLFEDRMQFQIRWRMTPKVNEVIEGHRSSSPRYALVAAYPSWLERTDPNSSWRNMLLLQPPCRAVALQLWYTAATQTGFSIVYNASGTLRGHALTIGCLMRRLQELISQCKEMANARWHLTPIEQRLCPVCSNGEAHVPWHAQWEIDRWEKWGQLPSLIRKGRFH